MMVSPLPRELHDAVSMDAWERGVHVLQGNRLGPTDFEHVRRLLELMSPPESACVLDIGSGFGEPARLMQSMRHDLRFVLLNDSAVQLSKAPVGECFAQVLADMHSIPLPDAFFDGAMALYSLCHSDLPAALAEVARVVKPGGFLFVYDYERKSGDNQLMERHLRAHAHSASAMVQACLAAGWVPEFRLSVEDGDDSLFRDLMSNNDLYDAIFSHLTPVIWRMLRR